MDWTQRAKEVSFPTQAFINGEYSNSPSGKTFAAVNPANNQTLANITACDESDVNAAVESARRAFNDGRWSRLDPAQRKGILKNFAAKIRDNSEELALLETLEMGKPITDSLTVDVPLSADCFDWFGEAIDKLYDEVAPTGDQYLAMVRHQPMGVVAAVVPWNFPLLMACWKLGPALAAGNSVVLKPAEQSSMTALKLGGIAKEAGIPDGVLNIVPGLGEVAGKALGLHNDVDCVTFTGSGEVGKLFQIYSGQSNMKRISLECGGKSPQVVFSDCDLDEAASGIAWGIFYNQGEVCNAGSRLLIEESIKDVFLKKVIEIAKGIQPGDPLDPNTKMGAIVDGTQMERILGYIEAGKSAGAKVIEGGEQVMKETGGHFIPPTIFDNVTNDMKIAREEIFGPVLSVITVKDYDDAMSIANDTDFGLAAAVWTKDTAKGLRASRDINAGTVWINCFDQGSLSVPFGGFKQSGFGRDKSIHALNKYRELKSVWVNTGV